MGDTLKKLFVPMILGTDRQGRKTELVAHWLVSQVGKREDIETKLFDVRDFAFPTDDYGGDLADRFPDWKSAITNADGLIIVTPEYNHSYPGILKSVLDVLLKEYIHKAVAFVGVSAGPWGGTRVIESLVPMVRELGLVATFTDLNFPNVQNLFDASGTLTDDSYEKRAKGFLDELAWMSSTLRWGRENLPRKGD